MKQQCRLTPAQKEFFTLVTQAAFSNPFGRARQKLDQRISGLNHPSWDKVLKETLAKVGAAVQQLEAKGPLDFRFFPENEREIVRITLLFDVFHRVTRHFDNLIVEQLKTPEQLCPVPFYQETFALLYQRGFTPTEAKHYFAFFYQLRRAFYFIQQSLVGESPAMENLRCHLWNNIFTFAADWYEKYLWDRMEDFSTILLGETGTGKGAAAAAIGRSGYIPFEEKKECFTESFAANFSAVNLAQFSESLLESELFGHKKGSFTGAIEDHKGIFARCTPHGTIFLDEIGDVSAPVQLKLLKILQERAFTAVGSRKAERFSGRVITATNKDLTKLRQTGVFRDDFFYRLCSDVIVMPTLRQRLKENPRELDILLSHVLTRITGQAAPELASAVLAILEKDLGRDYPWPGNVRELEQAVRRVLLTRQCWEFWLTEQPPSQMKREMEQGTLSATQLLATYCQQLYKRYGTYEEVARITELDRRTVKKYIQTAID